MKKCLYCAEEIQDEAIKCKHCGEFFKEKEQTKWYLKTSSLVIAFLCVGPLALPLLWMNKRYSKQLKISVTAIVVILTVFFSVVLIKSVKVIIDYYNTLFQQL